MATGKVPFDHESEFQLMRAQIEETPRPPSEIYPGVSPAFERIISKAMVKDPDQRFQSAKEFHTALLGISGEGIAPVAAPAAMVAPAAIASESLAQPPAPIEKSPAPQAKALPPAKTPESHPPLAKVTGASPERTIPDPPSELEGALMEPDEPPRSTVALTGTLDPAWRLGRPIGGGLCLLSIAAAIAAMYSSSPPESTYTRFGMLLLLLAIAGGVGGVLARKLWGYILALGATGLGALVGVLWTVKAALTPELSPWLPGAFSVCCIASFSTLYRMRWGPRFLASGPERHRARQLSLSSYTTNHGELAYAGVVIAVLATVTGGLWLFDARPDGENGPSMPANFTDGMQLEGLTEPPSEGSLVLARWGSEDYFFIGRVDQLRGDDEVHVTFLDGDEAWLRQADLRQDAVREGASVHIHVQDHEGWLPARITERRNNRVEADIGPQRVWVHLAMVRAREL